MAHGGPDRPGHGTRQGLLAGHEVRPGPYLRLSRVLAAEELAEPAQRPVLAEEADADGLLRLEVTFQGSRHAEWALWHLGTDAEALAPQWLRDSLRDRDAAIATRYGVSS